MKLRTESVLEGIAEALRDRIAPQVSDDYAANAARMAQSLLAIVRLARDDEVALKVEENRRMREIFAEGAEIIEDEQLASRLAAAAASQDPSLRIGELDAETGRLRALLVELHTDLDTRQDDSAIRLGQSIWRALRDIELPRAPRA